MARRAKQKTRHPLEVTGHRRAEPEVAQAKPVANGPTCGYHNGKDGLVVTADFPSGVLPKGWKDSPGKCSNHDGNGHYAYEKVDPEKFIEG
jgi:hypothetical protein